MDPNLLLQLISLAITAGTNLVIAFKHNADGTVDISVTQTRTLDKLTADLQQAVEWAAAHPTKP